MESNTEITIIEPASSSPLEELFETKNNAVVLAEVDDPAYLEDIEKVRKNAFELYNIAHNAVKELADLAYQGSNPDNYEVLAKFLKETSELNKAIMEASRERSYASNKPDKKEDEGDTSVNIDKAMFIGSTADLAKMISDLSNKNEPNQ